MWTSLGDDDGWTSQVHPEFLIQPGEYRYALRLRPVEPGDDLPTVGRTELGQSIQAVRPFALRSAMGQGRRSMRRSGAMRFGVAYYPEHRPEEGRSVGAEMTQ
jgi:hypothetical protein